MMHFCRSNDWLYVPFENENTTCVLECDIKFDFVNWKKAWLILMGGLVALVAMWMLLAAIICWLSSLGCHLMGCATINFYQKLHRPIGASIVNRGGEGDRREASYIPTAPRLCPYFPFFRILN